MRKNVAVPQALNRPHQQHGNSGYWLCYAVGHCANRNLWDWNVISPRQDWSISPFKHWKDANLFLRKVRGCARPTKTLKVFGHQTPIFWANSLVEGPPFLPLSSVCRMLMCRKVIKTQKTVEVEQIEWIDEVDL